MTTQTYNQQELMSYIAQLQQSWKDLDVQCKKLNTENASLKKKLKNLKELKSKDSEKKGPKSKGKEVEDKVKESSKRANPFIIFASKERKVIKEKGEATNKEEINKLLKSRWEEFKKDENRVNAMMESYQKGKDSNHVSTSESSLDSTKSKGKTKYNEFMQKEIAKIKSENPGIVHKEAFKRAAGLWKDSPENPKAGQ